MSVFINLSTYRFTPLESLPELREHLLELTNDVELKGTILLSAEGINLFVAGTREATDTLIADLRTLPGLADLTAKESLSDEQPYSRMLVKIKKEIIAFGIDDIDPANRPAPKLAAKTLKQWLDEGKPITLLDTRNDYEIKMGTFKGAVDPKIETFREFPNAVRELPAEMKDQPIVMFCTGGIRCEKAGPFMEKEGYKNIFQLDGGILKYFEECGGAHYDGECFVFDKRVGVGPDLEETKSALCFSCQMPLNEEEQQHPHYNPPETCPNCYDRVIAKKVAAEAKRAEAHAFKAKVAP